MNCQDVLSARSWPTAATARRIRHHVSRWARWTGDPPLSAITVEVFDRFRRDCLAAGLSPWTVESTIWEVVHLAKLIGYTIDTGQRLRRPPPQPRVPSLGVIGRLYLAAESATWPRRSWASPGAWWRCLLVVALWTGWRRSDLARLTWADVEDDRLVIRAQKTGIVHQIPMSRTVRRHLDITRRDVHRATVFDLPASTSYRACHDQLARLAKAAGCPVVTLQQLRQAAITNWSATNAEAGRIVHGCGLGVMRHYLDAFAVLEAAAPLVRLPDVFLTDEERASETKHRQELLDLYARAGRHQKRLILGIARSVTR